MGMPAIPPTVTTLDEFFALPEDSSCREELLDGVYVVSPNPTLRHQVAVMELSHRLTPALQGHPDLMLFLVPGDIVLGPRTVVVPDLFVIPKPPSVYVHWRDVACPILPSRCFPPARPAATAGSSAASISRPGYPNIGLSISTPDWSSAGGRTTSGPRS